MRRIDIRSKTQRQWASATVQTLRAVCLAFSVAFMLASGSHPTWAAKAEEEAGKARCPEGEYGGPRPGIKRFTQDPYVWFISREFATRFCMPEEFIDDSLKGALALAVRLKTNDEVTCGMFLGRSDQCPVKERLLIDIYLDNRKANIPKADPSVEYYAGRIWNSGWYTGVMGNRAPRRRRGEITEAPGERRPFSPAVTNATSGGTNWVDFMYLAVREGGLAEGGSGFMEDYYRANWADGIDLLTLDGYGFGYASHRDPLNPVLKTTDEEAYPQVKLDRTNPVRHWAIGVIQEMDRRKVGKFAHMGSQYAIPYPQSFQHTIELPLKVVQLIHAYDHKEGGKFFNSIQDAIRPPAMPSNR